MENLEFKTEELDSLINVNEIFEAESKIEELLSEKPEVSVGESTKIPEYQPEKEEKQSEVLISDEIVDTSILESSTQEKIIEDTETEKLINEQIEKEQKIYEQLKEESISNEDTGFFKAEEDESITLSNDELANILEETETKSEISTAEELPTENIQESTGEELGEISVDELEPATEEVLEPIEQVTDEQNIPEELKPSETIVPEEIKTEPSESFFGELEDESISLSDNELENILQSAEIEETPSLETTKEESTPAIEEISTEIKEEVKFEQPEEKISEPISFTETEKIETPIEEIPVEEVSQFPETIISPEEELKPEENLEEQISIEEIPTVEEIPETIEKTPALEEEVILKEEELKPEEPISIIEEAPKISEAEPITLEEKIIPEEELKTEEILPIEELDKEELKKLLIYLDNLLENLPEDKIKEFAQSEYYDLYSKILSKLGI